MRGLLMVAVMCGVVSGAQAADMPDLPFLRGSFTEGLSTANVNWGGGYIGGHASHGAADMDFTNSGQDLLAKLLNNVDLETQFNISKWPLLGKAELRPAKNVCRLSDKILPNRCPRQPLVKVNRR